MRWSLLVGSTLIFTWSSATPSPQPAASVGRPLRQATRESVIASIRRKALGPQRRQTSNAPYPVCPGEQASDLLHAFPWAVYPDTIGTYDESSDLISATTATSLDACILLCQLALLCTDISWQPSEDDNCYLLSGTQTALTYSPGVSAVFRDNACASLAGSANGRPCCNIYTTLL
ncbi:hypothetical protein M231_05543 [Tremella mesenterica]|uniref:Apple domain-containing protein n=1 Tax=Tremella mesenterica TaxID=5217 RepID=A0A4Q1BHU2_TREME|nr:hypothetical protein M231_05543 [Tremella mesenterica]